MANNRWQAGENDFAIRLELHDVEGFFSKKLVIEPGTRALFLERGQMIGEVPPGEYTLQGLFDLMTFWSRKSTVVILTRGDEVLLDIQCSGLATREMLEAEVKVRLAVHIEDVALFFKNMMGSRAEFSKDDLRRAILPIVHQALYEAVGRLSIRDLTADQARGDLETAVSQALGSSLSRHGLGFSRIQTLSVSHPRYDEQRRRAGELWLQRMDLEYDKSAAKMEADRLVAEIERYENLGDIDILAKQVATDRLEKELEVKRRRIGIRKQWRAAVLAGEFDKIQSEEELGGFLKERDKQRLIRQDEYDALATALREKAQDRTALRQHLLRKLDIEQQSELQGLRIDLDFAQKKRTKEHEIELVTICDSEDARKWKANLEREKQDAEERRAEDMKQLEHARAAARVSGGTRREEELAEWRHRLEIDHIQGDIETAQAERRRRMELVQEERNRRDAEWQLERWQKVRAIKEARKQGEFERGEQTQRRMHEETLAKGKQEIEKIAAHRGLTPSELMAVSENADIIADVEKHRATQQGAVEVAKANSAEAAELRDKLAEAHKTAGDGTIAALQQSLQSQQTTFDQFGKLVDNITRNLAPQPGSTVVVSGGSATRVGDQSSSGEEQRRVVVCTGCRTENEDGARHCRQCGKAL